MITSPVISVENTCKFINKLTANDAWRFVIILGPTMAVNYCQKLVELQPVDDIRTLYTAFKELGLDADDAREKSILVLEELDEELRAKETIRLERKKLKHERKIANRAKYLPSVLLKYYQTNDGKKRWTAETKQGQDLRSQGLLPLITSEGITQPVNIGLLNMLPPEDGKPQHIPNEIWNKVQSLGYAVSGERLGWHTGSQAWTWLVRTFPNAIDMAAYNHSLNAPVYPDGYFPNLEVVFKRLTDPQGNDLKTDGSGIYHPEHPALSFWVSKYGAVPIQFRYITEDGLFAKGVLFPSDLAIHQDKPAVCCDYIQVKGLKKAQAKDLRKTDREIRKLGHLGVIGLWNRRGTLKGGFEMLENIQLNSRTKEIIERTAKNALNKLVKDGIDGLLAEVARESEQNKLILQMIAQINAQGTTIHAASIPMISRLIESKLGRRLYHITQGAGIEFSRYVVRLDATLEPGTCVISNFPAGVKVCGFRFPIVLSQALLTMTTVEPRAQDMYDGKTSPWTVVIHPKQAGMIQGDDDGDTMGISTDTEMIELFSHLIDPQHYHIEPEGQAMNIPSESPEGAEYMRVERTGIVGLATVWRSKFLAVGDLNKANAMSLVIQENIDCAKRKVKWSDWRAASYITNWTSKPDGMHFRQAYQNEGECPDEFPEQHYTNWCKKEIKQLIDAETDHRGLLGWKTPDKRISIHNFHPTTAQGYQGGNLVHHCHNYVQGLWQEVAASFNIQPICSECTGTGYLPDLRECSECTGSPSAQLKNVLSELLKAKGYEIPAVHGDVESYKSGLQAKSGLKAHNLKLGQIMLKKFQSPTGEEQRIKEINMLQDELWQKLLQLNLAELAHIWYWECTIGTPAAINNAFRAISHPKSPILEIMEMNTDVISCPFLNEERINTITKLCLESKEPHERLAELIYSSQSHGKEIRDTELDEPIHGYSCRICIEKLEKAVINAVRISRTAEERQFVTKLVPQLNNTLSY